MSVRCCNHDTGDGVQEYGGKDTGYSDIVRNIVAQEIYWLNMTPHQQSIV